MLKFNIKIKPTVAISAQYIGDIVNSMPTPIPQQILPAYITPMLVATATKIHPAINGIEDASKPHLRPTLGAKNPPMNGPEIRNNDV